LHALDMSISYDLMGGGITLFVLNCEGTCLNIVVCNSLLDFPEVMLICTIQLNDINLLIYAKKFKSIPQKQRDLSL